jgi:hypothetical protein
MERIAALGFAVLALAAVACNQEGSSGRSAASPETGTEAAVLLADDFSTADANGWTLRDSGDYGNEIRDGQYLLWVDNDAAQYVANGGFADGAFADVRIEVTATKLSGSPSAGVGVHCRRAPSKQHGSYYADVDEEGSVRIAAQGDDQEILAETEQPGVWEEGANRLRLDCVGEDIAFWLNGKRLLQAHDGRYRSGRIGLGAGGAGRGETRVAFDDLKVTAPGPTDG